MQSIKRTMNIFKITCRKAGIHQNELTVAVGQIYTILILESACLKWARKNEVIATSINYSEKQMITNVFLAVMSENETGVCTEFYTLSLCTEADHLVTWCHLKCL